MWAVKSNVVGETERKEERRKLRDQSSEAPHPSSQRGLGQQGVKTNQDSCPARSTRVSGLQVPPVGEKHSG